MSCRALRMISLLTLLALAACGSGSQHTALPPSAAPAAKVVPPYEIIKQGGPVVVLLAMDAHSTLYNVGTMGRIPSDLLGAGMTLVSMDLPCHGADAETPGQLDCWRNRIERGQSDLFSKFCADLSAVIDDIGAKTVSVIGLSRGAYVAVTCAASDIRIQNLELLIPLTDLQKLQEFDGYTVDESKFGLTQYVDEMQSRNILVRTSAVDTRVDATAAITFAHAINAELDILPVEGHILPSDERSAMWIEAAARQ